ncbi:MAG TPA: hypothetical protein PLX77_02390, partial [Candidatus Cloacimonadota bacterium]|nr:hypothetical protein [Candidatus Cloacimonadota bacterium]
LLQTRTSAILRVSPSGLISSLFAFFPSFSLSLFVQISFHPCFGGCPSRLSDATILPLLQFLSVVQELQEGRSRGVGEDGAVNSEK